MHVHMHVPRVTCACLYVLEQAEGSAPLDTPTQVSRLIDEAQSHENLCQMYHGWNPAW